ncbi:MAG: PspC domain-containing protein [Candidatus Marinimicrobia bacterium]|nr:PspC domain-containing protein [Candidatus Neomarinimicrobiota bacterium]
MSSAFWPLLVIALGLYLFIGQGGGGGYKSQINEVFPPGKQLRKSTTDRKISGVCAGIGEYFNIDANIIRIFWVMATLGSFGFGILAYLALAIFLEDGE